MKHKLLSLFFAALVAMNMFATDVWDGSSDIFTHGAGTEQSPYLIENAEQLAFIAEMVNAGIYTYSGNYFKLTTDLDLNNTPWTPIGESEEHAFGGSFDGDNHIISNLRISSATNAGLFGVVSGGTYKRITVQGNIPASANATNAGGLIGYATAACVVDSCTNNIIIEGGENVGGIIGYAINASLFHCINHKNLKGKTRIGGIIGFSSNTIKNKCVSCVNYGTITSLRTTDQKSQSYIGGIIGLGNLIDFYNSINFGNINGDKSAVLSSELGTWHLNNCTNCQDYKCEIDIQLYVGGLAGVISTVDVDSCYNFGTIYGSANITGTYKYNQVTYYDWGYISGWHLSAYYLSNICCLGGGFGSVSNASIRNLHNVGNVISDYNIANCSYTENKYRYWSKQGYNIGSNDATYPDDKIKHVYCLNITRRNYLGGIVGDASSSNIYLCMNRGDIGEDEGAGIVGNSQNTLVSYCANAGSISPNGISANANVKNSYAASNSTIGISSGTVTNSYYINGSGNGTQKTEAQIKSASMPILLNADSTVFIQDVKPNVNKGYPIFKKGHKYIATNDASDVSYTSAMLNGNYYNCTPLVMGFEYKEEGAENYLSQTVSNASPAQYELTNLTQGTTYVARYWLVDNGIKYFGDTIHFTTLACPTEPVRSDTVRLCQGESYEFAGKTLTQAGVYHDSLVATTGCDSVIELVLQVTDTYKYPRTETINRGESYDFYGQLLTEPGVYNEYIRTTNRCNWIELTLIVHELDKTLTLNVNNPLWGSVVGAGTFEHGTVAEFSAIPAEGCYFVGWSDGDSNAERAILLTKDTTITANFAIHQYTISTQATNGTITGGGTYNYGTQVNLIAVADEHYHFVRWSDGDLNATRQITVTENKSYTAIFEKDRFLVLFKDDDGTELKRDSVEYGVLPTAPTSPSKESTAQYEYSFNGWTPAIVEVTQNATYTATYTSTIRSYTVKFLNEDGSEVSSVVYQYGQTPVAPTNPTKTSTAEFTYTFAGWDKPIAQVQGDQTYRATFNATKNSYTITWQNEDGSQIDQTTVEYGLVPTHADPVKQNTAEYTYTFAGWTPNVVAVTGNATYRATFNATKNSYTITWQNEDGSLIDQTTVEYGIVPTHAVPVKQNTAEYTYTFAGWTPNVVAVTGEATYRATFNAAKNSYTITWQNEDGSLMDQTTVEYGIVPTHADPVKQNTAEYTYTFAGWTPKVVAVTGNATYRATFNATKNSYTITWQNEDGSLIDQTTVEYGVVPTHADPVKESTAEYTYTFAGWTPNVVVVKGNATYRATFNATKNKYLIIFRNDDGTELQRSEVEYGTMPIAPTNPTKESTAQYDYMFTGWNPSVVAVTQAATYTATYAPSVRSYIITFVNDDNSIISMQSYNYGEFPTLPATPTKQATAEYTYTFAGWTPNIARVSGDATYKATFNATKNSYTITWQNEDGSLIDQTTVEYGVIPTHADPVKTNTAEYTYTFTGWTPAVVAVSGNATYRATFNATKNSYTITWQNEDGSLIDQTTVEYGVVPTHADPVKENTAEYTYTFTGWTPAVVAVTGNATYRATFSSEVNMYSITTNVVNGEVEGVGVYLYGTEVTLTAIPNDGYAFDQWSDGVKDNPRTIIVLGDAEYTALFTSTESIDDPAAPEKIQKVIIDDKVYILRGDKIYSITGQEVK